MPIYAYNAYTSEGRRVTQREAAAGVESLRLRLRQAGLFLCSGSIREVRAGRYRNHRIRLGTREIVDLFRHLELQLGAGVLSDEAIAAMTESAPNRRVAYVLREIHGAVTNGRMAISEAFGLFPRTFPPGVVTVIRAGERAGASELGRRFGDLRSRLEFAREVRNTALRAFQYPALVAALATGFVAFVFSFLVPILARVLETVNVQLPPVTAALITMSRWCGQYWPHALGIVLVVGAGWWSSRALPRVALVADRAALVLPFFGSIYRSLACSIVFRTYASLYEAGEPAPEVLDLCTTLVRNRAVRTAIAQVRSEVVRGEALHTAFRKSGVFPSDACAMVKTGEVAGLGESMRIAAEYHAARARERITSAVSWIEPVAIVTLGLFVGLVAYAFLTPILSIYEGIR